MYATYKYTQVNSIWHALYHTTSVLSNIGTYGLQLRGNTIQTPAHSHSVQNSPVAQVYILIRRLCSTPLASGMSQRKIPDMVLSELRLRMTVPEKRPLVLWYGRFGLFWT